MLEAGIRMGLRLLLAVEPGDPQASGVYGRAQGGKISTNMLKKYNGIFKTTLLLCS